MRLALWAVLVASSMPLLADDLETLSVFNVNFDFKPGWTLQLHSRVRTFEDVSALNQFRVGPIVMVQMKPRFTALGGYYYIEQNTRHIHRTYPVQRVWGGGQYRFLRGESWSVDGRSLIERHISPNFPDYWRWRNRAMFTFKSRIGTPYVSGEALVQPGVWYGRYTAGLQWQIQKRILVGAGYEFRQAPAGPNAHIIATFFQWTAHRHTPPHID
ncbi:MAG: DUF2490 domain-containing protein [Acidobacteria bacterium]|nr:DUF2490 domain-containing protein [Acidobacteriota bacterium]